MPTSSSRRSLFTSLPSAVSASRRFCATNSTSGESATRSAKPVATLIEGAATPLYQAVSQAKTADEVAEACLHLETFELKEGPSDDVKLANAGLRLVAAESLTQIGLLDDATREIDAALAVLVPALGDKSYYAARCRCLRSRLHALGGDREQAMQVLEAVDATPEAADKMGDAPAPADAHLLMAFVLNARAAMVAPRDAMQALRAALESVNKAVKAATTLVEQQQQQQKQQQQGQQPATATTDDGAPAAPGSPEQTLFVALTMRATTLVDTASTLLRLREWDDCLSVLDRAEDAAKALPSFVDGQDHPALGDIDYHRAVALMSKGDAVAAAAKASVAYRILADTLPIAVDKLAEVKELEASCLSQLGEGERAVAELDRLIAHVRRVKADEAAQAQLDPRVADLALRKGFLTKLSILDNRGEYDGVLRLFADGLDELLTEASPEGRLFAASRRGQALALRGDVEAGAKTMREVIEAAPSVVPERVPDLELTLGFILCGAGKREEADACRAKALEALAAEKDGVESLGPNEFGEWLLSAATVAAEGGHTERACALIEESRGKLADVDFALAAAPLYHSMNKLDEATALARQALSAADVKPAEDGGAGSDRVEVSRSYGEVLVISGIDYLRKSAADATADAGRRQRAIDVIRSTIASLRKDGRHRVCDQLEATLNTIVPKPSKQ